jgi:MFS transporter, DHA1 family, multidrug resistance protein
VVCALCGLALLIAAGGLTLTRFLVVNTVCLYAIGLTFGNFSAIALQPFAETAGAAAAVQATVMTLMSLIAATIAGNLYDGTLVPLMVGYGILGGAALIMMRVSA